MSPATIGATTGRSPARVIGSLNALLATRGRTAVRSGAMSAAESAALLRLHRAGPPGFVNCRYRTSEQPVAFLCRMP